MRLDFLVTKGPLVPFNSTICPRNGPKRRQKGPKTVQCTPAPRNQEWTLSWATWLKNQFRGILVDRNPPLFVVSKPQNRPTRHVDPRTSGHLVQPEGRPAHARTVVANGGSTRVPGAKKIIVSKVVPSPLGMLKQVFLGRFEPVVDRFGPCRILKRKMSLINAPDILMKSCRF